MKTNMKAIRTLRGLTQQEVADAIGVKVRTYRSWEQGNSEMGLDDACAVANVLGCSLDELAGRVKTISTEYYSVRLD